MSDKPLTAAAGNNRLPSVLDVFDKAIDGLREKSVDLAIEAVGLFDPRIAFAGKVVQAAARGSFLQQLKEAIHGEAGAGRIKPEFLESEQAWACFADLLDYVDRISPDPERFRAIRQAFLRAMKQGETGKNAAYAQQMLRVIYELSAGELVVLASVYDLGHGASRRLESWLVDVANKSGILRTEIVETIEQSLMAKKLLLPRVAAPETFPPMVQEVQWGQRNRLTTLGQEVCEAIMKEREG